MRGAAIRDTSLVVPRSEAWHVKVRLKRVAAAVPPMHASNQPHAFRGRARENSLTHLSNSPRSRENWRKHCPGADWCEAGQIARAWARINGWTSGRAAESRGRTKLVAARGVQG